MITKPMLAVAVADINALKFPVLVTPKLDGIRCLVADGKALSRKFKPIPNLHIRKTVERHCPNGFDGELMVPGATFSETTSAVMSHDGEPKFEYHVFDFVQRGIAQPYCERVYGLREFVEYPDGVVVPVMPKEVENVEQLLQYEAECLAQGYEGVMIRSTHGPYKCGRSTLREGYLLKLKRFEDSEAEIIGFEEKMRNDNELGVNELGYAKRSTFKTGLVPAGTLGALLARDAKTGVEFAIGTGLDDAIRSEIWASRERHMGRIFTYKFQPTGMKDKPRFPVFKGFRSADDISE